MTTSHQLQMDTLAICHQDDSLVFKLKEGGYCIKGSAITISVETEAINEEQFPDCALFCLENHPITSPLRPGDVFECKGGMLHNPEHESVKAHGYFLFHAEEMSLRWTVQTVEAHFVVFTIEATHDDIRYYDKRAKRTPTKGLFKLAHTPKAKLWIPS